LVPGLLHLPHLDPFLVALTLLKYAHPKWNVSTIRQHCRLLPLQRHPRCLCLDDFRMSRALGKGSRWGRWRSPGTKNAL
jgi:hypothetical protein